MSGDVWGEDGEVVRMWAVPVHPDGSMDKAQHSAAHTEHISDFRGLYGFGDVVTVHLRGVLPSVYEEAAKRARLFRARK